MARCRGWHGRQAAVGRSAGAQARIKFGGCVSGGRGFFSFVVQLWYHIYDVRYLDAAGTRCGSRHRLPTDHQQSLCRGALPGGALTTNLLCPFGPLCSLTQIYHSTGLPALRGLSEPPRVDATAEQGGQCPGGRGI